MIIRSREGERGEHCAQLVCGISELRQKKRPTHLDGLLAGDASHHGRDAVQLARPAPAHLHGDVIGQCGAHTRALPALLGDESSGGGLQPVHLLLVYFPGAGWLGFRI